MIREECASCGSMELRFFLELGSTPLAGAFMDKVDDDPDTYDLSLLVCENCFLVQLREVVPDEVLFNQDYMFYSSTLAPIQRYHRDYALDLIQRYPWQIKDLTVEIASNDGSLLRHFADHGGRTLGIDPAGGPSQVARDSGLDILTQPFNRALAQDVRAEHGQAGLIIANNVLAHVADPHDFLNGVADLLAPDGVAVFEVQYLGDLLAGNMFDHVYHEHRFYFSINSLSNLLQRAGLHIQGIRKTEPQGGSIRVSVSKDWTKARHHQLYTESWLRNIDTYSSFQGRVQHVAHRLFSLIDQYRYGTIAGFGATAKSTTLLNFCGLDSDVIDYVVDTTPAKVGKFTPGTRIPIISPEQELERGYPDLYLLLAWNYLGSVLRKSDLSHYKSTKWLVPIPYPVVL